MNNNKKVKKAGAASTGDSRSGKRGLVCCMNCRHALLLQYGENPVIAECLQKPNPYGRVPYEREVARVMRHCEMWAEEKAGKWIEKRLAV